eukprot:6773111-Alexandrium_andersonii.AAC.1
MGCALGLPLQPQNLDRRIGALEARLTGAQSVSTGGDPSPVGSPPPSAGSAAAGVGGGGRWTPDEWAQW